MTVIRSIHGIPQNELSNRGQRAGKNALYIPYLTMTKGEMLISLLADEAAIYAAAYPEFPAYQQAEKMYYDALAAGVSNGVNFVGALYDPILQTAAKNISSASKSRNPVSGGSFIGRQTLGTGVKIWLPPLYTNDFDHDCVQYATKAANLKFGRDKNWQFWKNGFPPPEQKNFWKQQLSICQTKVAIEKIMNDSMVDSSHHLLYKSISGKFSPVLGTQVLTKKNFHLAGIGGLSLVSEIGEGLMSDWVEAGLLRKNAFSGVGVFGSVSSSLSLAPDPVKMAQDYNDFLIKTNGQTSAIQGIGFVAAVTALAALVTAIGAAIGNAAKFKNNLAEKQANALATANGFGTSAYKSETADFLQAGTTSSNSNGLLIGGAILAALLLTKS